MEKLVQDQTVLANRSAVAVKALNRPVPYQPASEIPLSARSQISTGRIDSAQNQFFRCWIA